VCQKLLDFWLLLRQHLPRSSTDGFLKTVAEYQAAVDPEGFHPELKAATLGATVLKYEFHKRRLSSATALGLSEALFSPAVCPACHIECDSLSGDCCMKCNRFVRPGKGSGVPADHSEGNVFCLSPEAIEPHLGGTGAADVEGGASKQCNQFTAATATGKRSVYYDNTGIGALVCRHLHVFVAWPLWGGGERYGYMSAGMTSILLRGILVNKVCVCMVGCAVLGFCGCCSLLLTDWHLPVRRPWYCV
jgi:hypothetical protein